jgi:hypothetical protein
MAEVIGVLASGISIGTLAAQIASSITTLKSYWDEVKEVPEVVSNLLEDIEDLHSILGDIKDDRIRNPISSLLLDGTSPAKCLTHCRKAATRLSELVDELGADIDASNQFKRKKAAIKVVLTKKKLARYMKKLERTVWLLTLSHQCYTRFDPQNFLFLPLFIRLPFLRVDVTISLLLRSLLTIDLDPSYNSSPTLLLEDYRKVRFLHN